VNTRPALRDDANAIARIHVASWQAAYRGVMPDELLDSLSVERREAGWRSALERGEPAIVVATDDAAAMIGWIACGRCRDADATASSGEIWAIYVDPAHWSRGVGRALWNAARPSLDAQFDKVFVWVLQRNERARRFYTAAGFAMAPGVVEQRDFGGVLLDEVRLVRRKADR
jgi:ribosomal protein S18 acetylase RimI-like enzyme